MQEKGIVENDTYPDVCRDGHKVNSQTGLPYEHGGGDIWRAG